MWNLVQIFLILAAAGLGLYLLIQFGSFLFDMVTARIIKLPDRLKRATILFGLAFLLVLPWLLGGQPYVFRTVIIISLYIVLALSLNFVIGFAGQLSMGHAAFYGIGAYVTALLTVEAKLSFWPAMLASAVVAALFGFLLGIPTLRLKGDYLAITTIGFGELVRLVLINWVDVTRGPAGIPGVPSPGILGRQINSNAGYYYIILAIMALTVVVSNRLLNSRLGRGLIAIRDDETAAVAMGINPTNLKIMAFVLGAAIAGLAGSFFASYIHYVNPDNFTYVESVAILCMVVLGGTGSIPGVVAGAIILAALPEFLRDISTYRYAIYGMLLIIMMIIRPQGMISMEILKGKIKPRGIQLRFPKGGHRHANS